jgi:hypothetical protein
MACHVELADGEAKQVRSEGELVATVKAMGAPVVSADFVWWLELVWL